MSEPAVKFRPATLAGAPLPCRWDDEPHVVEKRHFGADLCLLMFPPSDRWRDYSKPSSSKASAGTAA
jgi:hypothetical protein